MLACILIDEADDLTSAAWPGRPHGHVVEAVSRASPACCHAAAASRPSQAPDIFAEGAPVLYGEH